MRLLRYELLEQANKHYGCAIVHILLLRQQNIHRTGGEQQSHGAVEEPWMGSEEAVQLAACKQIDEVGTGSRNLEKDGNDEQVGETGGVGQHKRCIGHKVEEDNLGISELDDDSRKERACLVRTGSRARAAEYLPCKIEDVSATYVFENDDITAHHRSYPVGDEGCRHGGDGESRQQS